MDIFGACYLNEFSAIWQQWVALLPKVALSQKSVERFVTSTLHACGQSHYAIFVAFFSYWSRNAL
jgi:hypothetical protein